MQKKVLVMGISLLLVLVVLLVFLLTFGKWWYLTNKFSGEFREPIKKHSGNCLLNDNLEVKKIRVESYANEYATILFKDSEGNEWRLKFRKENNEWTYFYDEVCNYESIESSIFF